MERLVKYKLIKQNGYIITPPCIYDGGNYWTNNNEILESVFYGKADIDLRKALPDGVIEVITQEQLDEQLLNIKDNELKTYKSKMYAKECDPLLPEALAEKMQGREEKWNTYLSKRQAIYDLTSIPEGTI